MGAKKLKSELAVKVYDIDALMRRLGARDFEVTFEYSPSRLGMTIDEFDAVLLSLEDFFTMDKHRVILGSGVVNFLVD